MMRAVFTWNGERWELVDWECLYHATYNDMDFDPVQRQEIDLADEAHRYDLMGMSDCPY
jgi:hypothetical protein